MTGKRDFAARIAAKLDIPREVLPGGFSLSLVGEGELTVRGCKRILLYQDDRIEFAVGKTVLSVLGNALYCTSFAGGAVTVTGKITAILIGRATDA